MNLYLDMGNQPFVSFNAGSREIEYDQEIWGAGDALGLFVEVREKKSWFVWAWDFPREDA